MYGIYNTVQKKFQFGICEPTAERAEKKLFKKIGNDARKWRFEARKLPEHYNKRIILFRYCQICKCKVKHERVIDDYDGVRITIDTCKICGNVVIDHSPIGI